MAPLGGGPAIVSAPAPEATAAGLRPVRRASFLLLAAPEVPPPADALGTPLFASPAHATTRASERSWEDNHGVGRTYDSSAFLFNCKQLSEQKLPARIVVKRSQAARSYVSHFKRTVMRFATSDWVLGVLHLLHFC